MEPQGGLAVTRESYDEYTPRLKPAQYTDQDQATMVVAEMGKELMYNNSMGFMRYDGTLWQADEEYAFGGIMEFMDRQIADALEEYEFCRRKLNAMGIPADLMDNGKLRKKALDTPELTEMAERYKEAKAYKKFVLDYRSHRLKISVQNEMATMVKRPLEILDRDPFLLNTPDATWNLTKGMEGKQNHNPDDAITNVTLCSPGEEGREMWEEALNTFFCDDKDLIDYVQEIVGMVSIGKVYMEAMIIAYGGGRNGKSTFWNAISRVLGTYSGSLSTDTLSPNCKRNVKPEMAELKGKRLVIASELEAGATLSTSMLKQLCSTDPIYAEKKYLSPFFFTPTHTLVLYTNHLPKVRSNDEGTWRRLIVIPFRAVIPKNNDVQNYGDYLVEYAGPAILQWIIEGAGKVSAKGFQLNMPEAVTSITASYRNENNMLEEYFTTCCRMGEGLRAPSGALYNVYRSFCKQGGGNPVNTKEFAAYLEQNGLERKKNKQGIMVSGVEILAEYVGV